jgi:hypothetical protein
MLFRPLSENFSGCCFHGFPTAVLVFFRLLFSWFSNRRSHAFPAAVFMVFQPLYSCFSGRCTDFEGQLPPVPPV